MRTLTWLKWIFVTVIAAFVFAIAMAHDPDPGIPSTAPAPPPSTGRAWPGQDADVSFVLETRRYGERVYYVGASGPLLGVHSPDLIVRKNDRVSLTLINGLDTVSDITVPAFGVESGLLVGKGTRATMIFPADHVGNFVYQSSFPKLRSEGLVGRFAVEPREEIPDPLAALEKPLTD